MTYRTRPVNDCRSAPVGHSTFLSQRRSGAQRATPRETMIYKLEESAIDVRAAARALDPSSLRLIAAELDRAHETADDLIGRMEQAILDWQPVPIYDRRTA